MTSSNGRVARLTALALATGTLVAAGATNASAATNNDIVDAGNAAGNGVIHLEVNLPAGISVPGLVGNHLTQDIVVTNSAIRTGSKPAALANSVLGQNGNIPLLSDILKGSKSASLGKATVDNSPTSAASNLLASVGLLKLESTVTNPNLEGTISKSSSSVADLHLGGDNVLAGVLAAITKQLQPILGSLKVAPTTATGATAAPIATVTQGLDLITGTLNGLTGNATAPATDAVKAAVAQVQALLDTLTAQLGNLDLTALSADSSLLDVGLIQSSQTVTHLKGVVTSTVDNKLVGVKLLGGLVSVNGLVSSATAALDAAGNPVDKGAPAASGSIAVANIANLITANLTNQLKVLLGGTVGDALGTAAVDQINAAIAQISGLLTDVLGVQFHAPSVNANTKAHNKSVQKVDAAVLTIDPLHLAAQTGGAPLLAVTFVPAAAQVIRTEGAVAPTVVTSTPTALPRTGANLPLTGAIATGLVGLAMVARRRRMTHAA